MGGWHNSLVPSPYFWDILLPSASSDLGVRALLT